MLWPPHALALAGFVTAAGLGCLLAFHPNSQAASEPARMQPPAEMVPGPVWVQTVVNAPGIPEQCADGTWTRTAVRGGCAHHGGNVYY